MKFSCTLFALGLSVSAAFAQGEPDPATGEPPPPPETTTPDPLASPPPPPPSTGPAVSQGAPAAEKTHGPILPNMLPSRLGATIDFRADYSHFGDESGLDELTAMGFVLHGQYILPEGYGFYGSIPYYYADVGEESDNGAGNFEIGGLFRMPQGEMQEILLRAGLALDTAGRAGGLFGPFTQIGPRFYDAYTTGFGATWVRAEGSFRHSQGNLRLAASAGFDIPVGQDDEDDGFTINVDALGKAAVSAGVEQPGFGAAVGFVFLYAIGAPEGSDDETSIGLNATVNVPINPGMAIYGAFGWPAIDDNDELDIFAIGAGVRAAIL